MDVSACCCSSVSVRAFVACTSFEKGSRYVSSSVKDAAPRSTTPFNTASDTSNNAASSAGTNSSPACSDIHCTTCNCFFARAPIDSASSCKKNLSSCTLILRTVFAFPCCFTAVITSTWPSRIARFKGASKPSFSNSLYVEICRFPNTR